VLQLPRRIRWSIAVVTLSPREPKSLTDEALAPKEGDELTMGTSVQWFARNNKAPSTFPKTPWVVQFDEKNCIKKTKGDWDWETGAMQDQIKELERIRDYGLRVIFGNWTVLKNHQFPGIDGNKKGLQKNSDGSIDVYVGPKAPAGKESNWIQSAPGKGWNTLLRLYGPLEPWFDKAWKPGYFELIE